MIDVFSVIALTITMKPLTLCGIPSALDDANHSEYISVCVGHMIITTIRNMPVFVDVCVGHMVITVNAGVRKTTSYRRTF